MEIAAFSIVGASIIAGMSWIIKTMVTYGNRLTRIETKLEILLKKNGC